jgi:hypothetical protein
MRTFAGLLVGRVALLLGLKLLVALVLPLFGLVVGLLALVIRLAVVAAVAYFVYALIRHRKREREA